MLTTAHPIFEHVPASFADPVGLADQQAQGVVSLIVVRYDSVSASGDDQDTLGHSVLGPTYDAFVASSGQLLAVARTTPDYRFPVTPAAALTRFITHRDAGHAAFLSLFELAEDECARFLETVFYSECLKLHVDGRDSAALVARQIARSGCAGGVLEVNDFSDPDRPRVLLLDLADLTSSAEDGAPNDDLATTLAHHLDGVTGRVLLYDRAKNRATLPDRSDRAFDLDGVIEQANRLALARRGASGEMAPLALPPVADPGAAPPDDQAEAVESYLRYQGQKLAARFDAGAYVRLTEAMDGHDVGRGRGREDAPTALSRLAADALCVGISSDLLYPPQESRVLADLLPNGRYAELDSPFGHDAFLVDFEALDALVRPFLADSGFFA